MDRVVSVSSQGIHTSLRGRAAAALAAIALAAASLVLIAVPASAHDELTGTDPASGATLEALPAELTLTFSSEIADDEGASEVQVTDAAGTTLTDGGPLVHDNELTQALAGEPTGEITVLWKVVSSDGHPISGEFSFTVTPPATPTQTPTSTPTPTETTVESASPAPSDTVLPEDPNMAAVDMRPWLIGGAIVLVLAAAAIAYLLVSRNRRRKGLEEARWREHEARAAGAPTAPGPDSDTPADR